MQTIHQLIIRVSLADSHQQRRDIPSKAVKMKEDRPGEKQLSEIGEKQNIV